MIPLCIVALKTHRDESQCDKHYEIQDACEFYKKLFGSRPVSPQVKPQENPIHRSVLGVTALHPQLQLGVVAASRPAPAKTIFRDRKNDDPMWMPASMKKLLSVCSSGKEVPQLQVFFYNE